MRSKRLLITITLLALLSMLGGCSRWGNVDNPTGPSTVTPKVYMDPASISRSVNQQFTISVYVENVTNLYYANIYIKFDPTKVSYVSSAIGSFLEQGLQQSEIAFNTSIYEGSILNVAPARLNPSKGGVSGSGTLCTVTFKAINLTGGTATNINFLNEGAYDLGFRDPSDNEIEKTVGNGTTVNII